MNQHHHNVDQNTNACKNSDPLLLIPIIIPREEEMEGGKILFYSVLFYSILEEEKK